MANTAAQPETAENSNSGQTLAMLTKRFNSVVRKQYFNMLAENLMPRAAPIICVAGLFAGATLGGLWAFLPPFAQATGMMTFAVASLAALKPMLSFRLPRMSDVIKRLDKHSGLQHQVVETLYSESRKPKDAPADPLWDLHIKSLLENNLDDLEAAPKRKSAAFEANKLKLLGIPAIALATGLYAGQGQYAENLVRSIDFRIPYEIVVPRIDAWITPPVYTGQYDQIVIANENDQDLSLPSQASRSLEGSLLSVRLFDDLTALNLSGDSQILSERSETNGARLITIELSGDTRISLTRKEWQSPVWNFNIVNDTIPEINFEVLENAAGQASGVQIQIRDDFGAVIESGNIRPRSQLGDVQDDVLPQYRSPEFTIRTPN